MHGILPNGGMGVQIGMIMNFEFKCPQCGKPVSADESYRGKVVECPHCTRGIVVPKNEVQRQATKTIHIKCPYCGTEQEATQQDIQNNISCAMCGKDFVAIAPTVKNTVDTASTVKENIDVLSPQKPSSVQNRRKVTMYIPTSEEVQTNQAMTSHYELDYDSLYVCTHCGESATSLRRLHGGCAGCLLLLFIPLCLFALWIGMFPPIMCLGGALFFLIFGIIGLCQGERTVCTNCGNFNTMVPGSSPQGIRMLKGSRPIANTIQPPPSIPPPLSTESMSQDVSERLNNIRKLLDNGLISAEEYEAQRKRILDSI